MVAGGLGLATGLETRVVITVPGLMAFIPMTPTATVTMSAAIPARTARGAVEGTSRPIWLGQGAGVLLQALPGLGGTLRHPGREDGVTNLDGGVERGDRDGRLPVLLAEDDRLH